MRRFAVLLVSTILPAACAGPILFSQNLGHAHEVKRGMTAEQALAIMGQPALSVTLDGVEEWRYCDSRSHTDEFVVLYFHQARIVEKASFTILNPAPNLSDGRIGDCRANAEAIYYDRRSPPRRVRELRGK